MQTTIKIGNKVYRIEISETKENLLKVKVNDKEYCFAKNELEEQFSIKDFSSCQNLTEKQKKSEIISPTPAGKQIKSPLAGVISAIMVEKGQKVKPGQKVITLISMKMENEIISEGHGKVKEIKVKENQFVNTGDVLIMLE